MSRAGRVFDVLVGLVLAVAAIGHGIDGNWSATTGYTLALAWFVLYVVVFRRAERERAAARWSDHAAAGRAFWDGVDAGRAYQATLDANGHRRDRDQEQA